MKEMLKEILKKVPFSKRVVSSLYKLGILQRHRDYEYIRIEVQELYSNEKECQLSQLRNVLNYTKTSGSEYSARRYPAGYHTLEIFDTMLEGQRKPKQRLDKVPYDFKGKVVLDIGCNQGGMIFALNSIKYGVGVDKDSRMINACNKVRSVTGEHNKSFYCFDIDTDPHENLLDFLPCNTVDIVFLLSVCKWVDQWKELIAFCASVSPAILFESNGTIKQREEQYQEVLRHFPCVEVVSEDSIDDPKHKNRTLYLAKK